MPKGTHLALATILVTLLGGCAATASNPVESRKTARSARTTRAPTSTPAG